METDTPLSINIDNLCEVKARLDMMLDYTINKMMQNKKEDAEITLKINIQLDKTLITKDNEPSEQIIPRFGYKITSKMTDKVDTDGTINKDWEVVATDYGYRIRPIDNGQMSIKEV